MWHVGECSRKGLFYYLRTLYQWDLDRVVTEAPSIMLNEWFLERRRLNRIAATEPSCYWYC